MGNIHVEKEIEMGENIRAILQVFGYKDARLGSDPVAHFGAGGGEPPVVYCFHMLVKFFI
jgi:hypothetical protein